MKKMQQIVYFASFPSRLVVGRIFSCSIFIIQFNNTFILVVVVFAVVIVVVVRRTITKKKQYISI